mmetsp:Transcript_37428/g.69824  ORF Transcript_37428/g.69824 Transcript_37428/m.69824 type:complete len:107 (+) Transcript_37428:83-403(+)
MSRVKLISQKAEFEVCLKLEKLVVFFSASWCAQCHLMKPKFRDLAALPEFSATHFVLVDVDKSEEIADAANIDALPAFLLFKKDAQVGELCGADEVKLKQLIRQST